MTDKPVLRYGMIEDHYWGGLIMYPQSNGDWVEYSEYALLLDKYNNLSKFFLLLKNSPVKEKNQCD
jgi:hypothetical protein